MAKDVYMPALGMTQETGTLLRWLKAEGDEVTKGEPLMEVATDKTDVEIEAPASGILRNVTAKEGDEIPVGQVIAVIAAPGETVAPVAKTDAPTPAAPPPSAPTTQRAQAPTAAAQPAPTAAASSAAVPVSPLAARIAAEHGVDLAHVQPSGQRIQKEDVLAYVAAREKPAAQPVAESAAGGRVLASPKARRLAQERGIELSRIAGSGPDGVVIAADVERYEAAPVAAPVAEQAMERAGERAPERAGEKAEREIAPMSRMWKVMADRLSESWRTVPHFYLERDVPAKQLAKWREQAAEQSSVKITYTDLLVKIVAMALRRHPRANAAWQDGSIVLNERVNIGLAVAVEDGLLVPVIHDADRLGLEEIAARRSEIVSRAQAGKLALDDLANGTFSISNLGMFGIDRFNAIVNPPQAAILAVGQIADRVVAAKGRAKVRPMMTLTLSCDHRVVDGARAAQFLATVAEFIETPMRMLG